MPHDTVRILVKGEDKTDSIRNYVPNNGRIEITYSNGKTYSYNPDNVQIKRFTLPGGTASECFEYLKRIAECTGLQDPDGGNFLLNRYRKIRLDADTMLSAWQAEHSGTSREEGRRVPFRL